MDLIIEATSGQDARSIRERAAAVFAELGFEKSGRHWTKGDLFVEVPATYQDDPAETVHVGPFIFRVIAKETLLVDRLAGFKHWQHTSYGQQAIDMIAAFGDALDEQRFAEGLRREDVGDAYEALRKVAVSETPVTEDSLQQILSQLKPS